MPITIAGSGTITGLSAGGLPTNSITTSSIADNAVTYAKIGTTEQGQLCKAWVNFNGTGTVAIRASYNVSSITDNGVGQYQINFTSALPDANYVMTSAGNPSSTGFMLLGDDQASYQTTTAVKVQSRNSSFTVSDNANCHVAIFR